MLLGQFAVRDARPSIDSFDALVATAERGQVHMATTNEHSFMYTYMLRTPGVTDPRLHRLQKVIRLL